MPRCANAPGPEVTLRADARRNRDRIVEAAREVFAEHGLDASLNEVARVAQVGVATLFRRFPNREELIAATFADRMGEYAALIETALEDPDPWHGFSEYVRGVCAMQVSDRGFTDVLTQSLPSVQEFEAEREQAFRRFTLLISRARKPGHSDPISSPRTSRCS
jgi:AcrR family transcriptional regulator